MSELRYEAEAENSCRWFQSETSPVRAESLQIEGCVGTQHN